MGACGRGGVEAGAWSGVGTSSPADQSLVLSLCVQNNPVLEFDQALLSEEAEPVAMAVGEEEDSAVRSLEVLDENNKSLKVCVSVCVWSVS